MLYGYIFRLVKYPTLVRNSSTLIGQFSKIIKTYPCFDLFQDDSEREKTWNHGLQSTRGSGLEEVLARRDRWGWRRSIWPRHGWADSRAGVVSSDIGKNIPFCITDIWSFSQTIQLFSGDLEKPIYPSFPEIYDQTNSLE